MLKYIFILLVILCSVKTLKAQISEDEPIKPLPESRHSIGLSVGYSQLSMSGNFNLNTYSSRYLYDDKNDIFEATGNSNYKISAFYNYYLNDSKIFAVCGNVSYSTRHAKLTAMPKYLIRDLATLDTATMLTQAVINTKFNALSIDVSMYGRLNVSENVYLFLGVGPNINFILDTKKSDYTATIIGLVNPTRPTDITFKNSGTQTVTFDNTQVPDLGNAVEGNSTPIGMHFSIGVEWFVKKDLAIKIESAAQGDFSSYFKSQSSGIIPSYYFSLGVIYSGLF